MKKLILSLLAIALISFYSCKESATAESAEAEETVEMEEAAEAPDYEMFNSRVEIIRAFYQAHMDEDLEAISNLLADSIKVSPPNYNGNQVVGKNDFLAVLKDYHDNFDNIKFDEGIKMGDIDEAGFWSGSVYPAESASVSAEAIRAYGTWTATHTESGKGIGVKYYSISWINDDGKIAQYTAYYDVNGIASQLAEE
jgi:ketosteroid isomerase-like protein